MLELTIHVLAAGMCALPFTFMGYVRSRVQHALRETGKGYKQA